MPPPPTDPPGLVLGPGAPYPDATANDADGPPTDHAAAPGEPGDGSHGLRVVDPAPAGLLETIVGDVAGYYLGGG